LIIELDGIWATEAEILSAAAMLNTDIHIYCNTGNENKWLKYKSVILGEKPVTTKSIFLDNSMVSMKIQRLFSALPGDNFSIAVELYILIIHRAAIL
jgi:hypothetical protein